MGETEYDMQLDRFGMDLDLDDEECNPRKEIKCRHCGAEDVYWVERDGKYVLYDCSSRQHRCNEEVVKERRLEAFDDLD